MKNIKNVRLCGLGLTVLSVLLHPAVALPAPTEDAPQNGAAQSDAGLAEIVVTAQKREQSINDVPMSITAILGNSLVQQGITSTADLAKIVRSATNTTFQTGANPAAVFELGSYALLDLRLGFASPDNSWRLTFFGRNVTNKYYWNYVFTQADATYRNAGLPATYGVMVSVRTR